MLQPRDRSITTILAPRTKPLWTLPLGRRLWDTTEKLRLKKRRRNTTTIAANSIFRSFFECAPLLMGVMEVDGRDIVQLVFNAAASRFFNSDPATMQNRSLSELGSPQEIID